MHSAEVPLLLLCGAPGTGKSSVGWEVYWLLLQEGVPVAHVDLDGIGYGPPGHAGSYDRGPDSWCGGCGDRPSALEHDRLARHVAGGLTRRLSSDIRERWPNRWFDR